MMTGQQSALELDALEAGFLFMPWSFSLADVDHDQPYSTSWVLEVQLKHALETLGIDPGAALAARDGVKLEDMKARFPQGATAAAWFEIGAMTMFICNMAGTGAPPHLLAAAVSGYQSMLRGTRPSELGQISRVAKRINLLSQNPPDKEDLLAHIMGSLRALADSQAPKAFLSHRSTDKTIVEPVAFALEGHKVRVWYDSWNIMPGDSFPGSIRAALRSSDFVVFFASSASVDPARAWIKEELDKADAYRLEGRLRALLIVLLGDCDVQSWYPHLQFIDARSGSGPKEIASRLHDAMDHHLARHAASA